MHKDQNSRNNQVRPSATDNCSRPRRGRSGVGPSALLRAGDPGYNIEIPIHEHMISSTKALVLSHIWNSPGTHRKEIASHFGLHPNLVSDAVRSLIKERWVMEGESKKTPVGRAPVSLYLDSKNRAAISVSYSPNSMTCGLMNANGDILRSTTVPHDLDDPDAIVDLAIQQFAEVKKGYGGIIIGIAVADPGMVNHCKGEVIRSSSFPGWRNVALAEMFSARTGLETAVVDTTHAHAIAQYHNLSECRKNADTMLYVDYDAGLIGFAFLTPNGIWRGEGLAGEVGHVVIDPEGLLCRCGAKGCLESQTSSKALENRSAILLKKGIHSVLSGYENPNALEIFRAAKDGDRFARTIVHDTLADLGLCTVILVAMLHPRLLVVGAETEDAISLLADELQQAINNRVISEIASTVTVIKGRPINTLSLTGAGLMLFERIIRDEGNKNHSRINEEVLV